VKLQMSNSKMASIMAIDGTDRKMRSSKGGVELLMDSNPVVVTTPGEIPIPAPCYVDTSLKFEKLLAYGNGFHKDVTEDGFFFRDAVEAYSHDPGGAFINLRKRFWILNRKMSKFDWIEAESTRTTNFSQVVAASGCSNGAALLLNAPITTDPRGFFATYPVSVKSDQDLEVWIAARIPVEARKYISVEVSGQRLSLTGGPSSSYSSGFGWYKLGTTKLSGPSAELTLLVTSPEGAYLAVDAILLYPGHFTPGGIMMPDAIPFDSMQLTQKKRGH
jgi:hypothetical protein